MLLQNSNCTQSDLFSPPIKAQPRKLNVLSLFSGCGGMDLGFEGSFDVPKKSIPEDLYPRFVEKERPNEQLLLRPTAFQTIFANDILKEAKITWTTHFNAPNKPQTPFREESIVELVRRQEAGEIIFPKQVDVITGGFPCQDFSLAGKRKGFHSKKDHTGKIYEGDLPSEETRGKLYFWMKKVIDLVQPNVFIAENVKGLVNFGDIRDTIQRDFSSAGDDGYLVLTPRILCAANYGIAQSRERILFIGIRKKALRAEALEALLKDPIPISYDPYPKPTHAFKSKDTSLAPPLTLQELFKGMPEPNESDDPSHQFYSKAKYMGAHCQGQIEINLKGVAPTIRSEHHGNIEFRRLAQEHGGKYTEELAQHKLERRLTPRECALIQSFPNDFKFVMPKNQPGRNKYLLSPSAAYKVIGNAVPPLLAYHIARRLGDVWSLYFDK